ncbi:hypothetical protein HanPI659440_Chr11g0416791 [Helianthus annuus]|nr:hypothetical protein HanPI659440_Chr11g0416791 [Helianthus annuus]
MIVLGMINTWFDNCIIDVFSSVMMMKMLSILISQTYYNWLVSRICYVVSKFRLLIVMLSPDIHSSNHKIFTLNLQSMIKTKDWADCDLSLDLKPKRNSSKQLCWLLIDV